MNFSDLTPDITLDRRSSVGFVSLRWLGLSLVSLLWLAGCATNPQVDGDSSAAASEQTSETAVELPFAEPEAPIAELDEDVLFHYLVGEIAAQRGELKLAYNHYLHAALLTGDGYAARRATQIAIFLKDQSAALKAANRWVSISPNSIQARNTAAIINLRAGNRAKALENLHALVKVGEALDSDGFLIAAVSLSKEGDKQQAMSLMEEFVAQYPGNANALYAKAVLYSTNGQHAVAVPLLEQTLALEPDWVKPKLLMVKELIDHRSAAEAVEYLRQVLPQHPEDTDLHLLYAKLLVADDHQGAYREFAKIHRKLPDNTEVISALGVLAFQLGDIPLAKRWWSELLEIGDRENRSEAAFQLGQLEELGGNNESAEDYYQQVNHGKYKIDARVRLARLQADMGKIDNAREVLKQLRVLEPQHVVEYYLTEARILHEHAEQEEVFALYRTALQASPGNLDLLYSRGIYAADQRMVDAAERDFRQVLSVKPDDADTLNALGYTLANQTDRYTEAFDLIKRALELKPDNAAILDSMGWVLYRMGNLEESVGYLRRALEKQSDDEIAAHYGEVLWMLGDKAKAKSVWSKALEKFPDSRKLADVMDRFK